MDKIKELASQIEGFLAEITSEIETAENKGAFVYGRAKNIRKAAQEIKVVAQELRTATTEEFKKTQG